MMTTERDRDAVLKLPARVDFRAPKDAMYYERAIAPAFKALRRRYRLRMKPLLTGDSHEDHPVLR